jgi:replicative DNA helicase
LADRTIVDAEERTVLGCMVREAETANDMLLVLREDDIRTDAHRRIFAALRALIDGNKPVEITALANELRDRGHLEDVGSYPYLAKLLEAAPTAANAEYYAGIVRDAALLRELARIADELKHDAANATGPAQGVLEQAERSIFAVAENRVAGRIITAGESAKEVCDLIDARTSGRLELKGIPTGWPDLDLLTSGLQNSELIVIAARPGVGKTTMGLALARHVVLHCGYSAFFASLEQTHSELTERLLCAVASVDGQHVRRGKILPDEGLRLADAFTQLQSAALFFDDTPRQSVLHIAASARRLRRRQRIRLVIVDYLQFVEPEDRTVPRHEQVSAVSRRLKGLARELAVPVVALAQVNRASEDRADKRPRLADLRESGGIEADADTVILLHRTPGSDGKPGEQLECEVAKQRNGPTGTITLVYRREFHRLENYEPDAPL